jgi:hypothetical protein
MQLTSCIHFRNLGIADLEDDFERETKGFTFKTRDWWFLGLLSQIESGQVPQVQVDRPFLELEHPTHQSGSSNL